MASAYRIYGICFVTTAFVVWAVVYLVFMVYQASDCAYTGKRPDNFLLSCQNAWFSDYEHGALYYGLEQKAVESLRAAQVITLSNSALQHGLIDPLVDQYFASHHIPYFQLGFGFIQRMEFPLEIFHRFRLSPKVLVINADPFFMHERRGPALDIWQKPVQSHINYQFRKWALDISVPLCRLSLIHCAGNAYTTYRSAETGRWLVEEGVAPTARPLTIDPLPVNDKMVEQTYQAARLFLSQVRVKKECVVLVGVPSPLNKDVPTVFYNPGFIRQLAAKLGVRSIIPVVERMRTRDHFHLDAPTAKRWSAEFIRQLEPVFQQCL